MIIGEVNELKVKRIGDISYILDIDDEELFLHKKEALKEHKVGDIVKVFIYMDSKRRICASELTPLITASKPACLKIVEIREDVGYFLYDGMPKDLLLSKDDVTFEENEKPIVGDYLFVYLKINPTTFRAKLVPKAQYQEYLKPIGTLVIGEFYKVYVTSRSQYGVTCHTKEGYEVFISKGNDRAVHRIGEALQVNIIKKIDDLHYHGSLLKKKIVQMDEDSRRIYEYLKKNRNEVLSEAMSPIEIYNLFQMSKSAFKRAVGKLYKERFIDIIDTVIKLKVE
ncbi:hypothetical protein J6Y73_05190 [bacterium]|nr:hypothetical protein [bacterium]